MRPNDLTISGRVANHGYFYVRVSGHPNVTSTGYVYEHRFVMELHLGRFLHNGEVIHHKNKNRQDNRLQNLELTTKSEHAQHHGKDATVARPDLRCEACGKRFKRKLRGAARKRKPFCSRACNMRFYRLTGIVAPTAKAVHGSASMYQYHKCRCDECRDGSRLRAKQWRANHRV